jgi:polyisoprenoid-binding protein YceI
MKKTLFAVSLLSLISFSSLAADYVIDTKGAHASINFKIKHLGYSWLTGRFNQFDGKFTYDESKPEASSVTVTIKTESFDSNHADRNKHIKSEDFLNVSKFPEAKFTSSKVENLGDGNLKIIGDFTLHGVTNSIVIETKKIGEGTDPWGGYRAGFEGTTSIALVDYGITYNLGPASSYVELTLNVEGVKQ